jgi:RNA polymerase sigma-70 factor, ECF subfamily
MPLPLPDSESGPSATPRADDTAARFERDALALRDQLYRMAREYARTHADAEDLVQETMTRAYIELPAFRGGNIHAWLFKIMQHTWIRSYRTAKRRPVELLSGDISESLISAGTRCSSTRSMSAELETLHLMGDDEVRRALQKLPEPQRMVVCYADLLGFRYREIAEILDMPMGSVMSRIYRGRRTMRRLLMNFGIEHGYIRGRDHVGGAAW